MNENRKYIEEDEIDLVELFRTLLKRKWFIAIFTFIITLGSIVFVYMKTPVYSGSVLLEIGEVVNNKEITKNNKEITNIFYLDDVYSLKEIVANKFGVNVIIPKKTSNMFNVSYENVNTDVINTKLNNVVEFIMGRHRNKIKLYSTQNTNIRMTSVVSKSVGNTPVKPKKKLIVVVAFVTGFILSIFLVFFMEFIQSIKEKNEV